MSKARLDDFARSLLQALNRARRGKVYMLNFTLIVEPRSIWWTNFTNDKSGTAIKTFGIYLP
jgi:hypothetical protein